MGVKKFINGVIDSLKIESFELKGKKKSLKTLLCKLKKRRVEVLKELKKEDDEKKRAALKEEYELVSIHIKNGKEKLNELKKS
jgi:hypothetical protein